MNQAKRRLTPYPGPHSASFRKDATLDRLADRFNVAQFVSFAPGSNGPEQQYCRLAELPPNFRFESEYSALDALFARATEGMVNIRSFTEAESQSREFIYGLSSKQAVLDALARLSAEGCFTIVNETVDVSDGGVSGVAMGNVVEFRPDSTPRGVERPGFASIPLAWALKIFGAVYGVQPDLDDAVSGRIEFSLHPRACGWKQSHVLYWEFEEAVGLPVTTPDVQWPNDFSRMLGDKVYGLLVGWAAGLPVPFTTVINRRVAPFSFGTPTGSHEYWTRTSPKEQVPGKFTTARGWLDPFRLLAEEDPSHQAIASVLAQQAVLAEWSGAAVETADGELLIEGTSGVGDGLMLGKVFPSPLPGAVEEEVRSVHAALYGCLGPVRFEWVFDGSRAWVVQLHRGASLSTSRAIVPGEANQWIPFDVADGLEALRSLVADLPSGTGIELEGRVGFTSHIADVLRKAAIPTRIGEPRD